MMRPEQLLKPWAQSPEVSETLSDAKRAIGKPYFSQTLPPEAWDASKTDTLKEAPVDVTPQFAVFSFCTPAGKVKSRGRGGREERSQRRGCQLLRAPQCFLRLVAPLLLCFLL